MKGNYIVGLFILFFLGILNTRIGISQMVMDSTLTAKQTFMWKGNRDKNGRPFVEQKWLKRASKCSFEDLWTALKNYGYNNQFEGGFEILKEDSIMVGRALTAQFLPSRLDLDSLVKREGIHKHWSGNSNSWPILQLVNGDIYVADGAGKIKNGTLIGDNLGSSIYASTGNGVVFNASARDRDGLYAIAGFNAWVKGWDPSYLQDMTLSNINQIIRIGSATVFPGDIVIGNYEGVLFLPYSIVDKVVILAELIGYRGEFGKEMLSKQIFHPGEIDNAWSDNIYDHFLNWLNKNYPYYKISKMEIINAFQKRSW